MSRSTIGIILLIVVAFAVGGVVSFSIGSGQRNLSTPKASDIDRSIERSAGQDALAGQNDVQLGEQQPGATVRIRTVRFEKPGFVVIRDELYGNPNVAIAISGLIDAGEAQEFELALSRDFAGEQTLFVELYSDNGDRRFRQTDDAIVRDTSGNPVRRSFRMTGAGESGIDIAY